MANRFYQVALTERPAYWEDIGNRITITGFVVEGEGIPTVILGPSSSVSREKVHSADVIHMSAEELSRFIQFSDNPQVLELDKDNNIKVIHRKVRYEISGHIQQKVWVRDNFKCMYCDARMGGVQLTIDHFVPLEKGGANEASNYLSACRKCNNRKGNLMPEDFMSDQDDYLWLRKYLEHNGDNL